ncbi:MAG TPA: NADH-quinone oxidoreductase subunit M [Thermoanaerobaculia bacterium]|nr:NADH-quinone oxidoreductase subunit M [Thermoanaerobaculia bacterium]
MDRALSGSEPYPSLAAPTAMATFLDLLAGDTLTRLVFLPALACVPLLFFRRGAVRGVKIYALAIGLLELAAALAFVGARLSADGSFPMVRDPRLTWIASYGIHYELAMDGVSMPLVLLTALLLPIVILGSWRGIERHWRSFAAAMLLLTTGVLGSLLAFDLFLFYVFWEVMLVPMYLLIGIWGGERRIYAAIKFFLFTMAGSLVMLVAILWLAWSYAAVAGGAWSFAYEDLLRLDLPAHAQLWLFAAFALAFLIKVPMVPLHTWLPDAHVEAPTGGSVILAGILLKLGTYGYLRFAMPLFPQASRHATPLLLALALVGILYGAMVSWVQSDMKKLVAYSSIAHLGFVMLGLLAVDLMAWQGALLQMINHGLSTGALFLLVGMLYDRRHTKKFEDFGGLAKVMPLFAFFLVFCSLASVGLPALNGFAGEFLILAGSFRSLGWPAAVATFGVVLAAIYLLKMVQLTLWGPIKNDANRGLSDLSLREIAALVPLCVLMLWIGVAPNTFLQPSEPALRSTLADYRQRLAGPAVREARLRPAVGPLGGGAASGALAGRRRGGATVTAITTAALAAMATNGPAAAPPRPGAVVPGGRP